MKINDIEYPDGNILWDNKNQTLIEIGSKENPYNEETSVATEIPITHDLLNLLGFKLDVHNDKYDYADNQATIVLDWTETDGFYTLCGEAVKSLNNIQDVFNKKNIPLNIDRKKLVEYIKKQNKSTN